jgi:hypothetical protein
VQKAHLKELNRVDEVEAMRQQIEDLGHKLRQLEGAELHSSSSESGDLLR